MRLKESLPWLGFVILAMAADARASKSMKRVKRIFNGSPVIGRDMGYSSVRYFAAIGSLHDRHFPFGVFESEAGSWSNGVIKCGGALVTPFIVQTACHCLADFEQETGFIAKYMVRDPVLMNVWETAYVIYVGINEERETLHGGVTAMTADNAIRTRKFVVHQNCGKLGKITQQVNTHDFGWITLEDWSGSKKVPVGGVSYAPLYDIAELRRLWKYFFTKLPVCLHLGFGRQRDGSLPDRMMHGWGVVMDRYFCLKLTSNEIPADDVYDVFTWFCSYGFPKHDQKTGKGNSGGPVACNDRYFGVVEGSSYHEIQVKGEWVKRNFTVASQITFALYENAIEYRAGFMKEMAAHSEVLYAELILHPTFNPFLTPSPPRHLELALFSRASNTTKVLTSIYLLLLSMGRLLGYVFL